MAAPGCLDSGLNDRLPANVIPDVAELFTNYASAALMLDRIVPELVAQLHAWLMEIECDQADRTPGRRPALGGGLDYEKRQSLHEYLRSSFLALSATKPDLAEQYVRFILEQGQHADRSAETVIKSPGNLARAAPKALAVVIQPLREQSALAAIIPHHKARHRSPRQITAESYHQRAFSHSLGRKEKIKLRHYPLSDGA
jgi:hypothetical protein